MSRTNAIDRKVTNKPIASSVYASCGPFAFQAAFRTEPHNAVRTARGQSSFDWQCDIQ
jgi:hypothetical protein